MAGDEERGASVSRQKGAGRFVRVLIPGKALGDTEGDSLRIVGDGAHALMTTAGG